MRSGRHRRAFSLTLGLLIASGTVLVGAPAASADATRSAQWYLGSLGITKAWATTKGKGVKIGIADTGIDGTIADLRGAVVAGKDFSTLGAAGGVVKGNSHGTNVASLAAGRGHGTGAGVIGAAPQASLVSAGIGLNTGTSSGTAAAIRWLVDQGVGVINMSFGAGEDPAPLRAAIAYAESKDVVLVAATGDLAAGAGALGPPASIPGVVAVTGIDKNLRRDPGATIGKGTALAAPFSTTATDPFSSRSYVGLPVAQPAGKGVAYVESVGTSLSAPIVAGIVALIRAAHPDENAATVITRLIRSATPAGGAVPNNTYGYGIVNAQKAVTMTVANTDTNPLGSIAPAGGSSSTGSSAPSSGSSSGRSQPSTPTSSAPTSAAAPLSAPTTTGSTASSDSSSGIGTGGVVAIVAAVVVVVAVGGWLVARSRRQAPPPPGYGPPPPGYGPPR